MTKHIEQLCKLISHGVYVIGVRDGERRNAFTAAWVMQVSFDPVMLAISINSEHYSYQLLKAGGICSVNVLSREHMPLAEHFGQSGKDKLTGFEWREAKTGAPVLAESLAYFDCELSHITDAGDHKVAICNVIDAGFLNEGIPMLYSQTDDMDGSSELYSYI